MNKKEILKIEQNIIADNALYIKSTGILSSHDLMTSFYIKSKNKDEGNTLHHPLEEHQQHQQLTEHYSCPI